MTHTDTTSRHLRVAPLGWLPEDGLVLDLGRGGKVVTITRDGWKTVPAAADLPTFRHTLNTNLLPAPIPGGSLTELRELLNVGDQEWAQITSWLLAALLPDITRPVLLLTGGQASGKSVMGHLLAHLIDPGGAFGPLPANEDAWETAVNASRVVAFDNVSHVPAWPSDILCAAVHGGGNLRRTLGSPIDDRPRRDDRAFILAGTVAPLELRGDLADRTVAVQLQRLAERRPEAELWKAYTEARPRILGALLDLLVAVLGALPAVREKAERGELPQRRMADYGLVLAALEEATGNRPE
ncbi:hypothetical protein ACGF7W_39425 [Streptomyces sp. NPDC048219]|uniref:hypothetical protein n=1 Tax=Streptomyces sp. NPDC048219 TaxID=3365517 RepID=UPI003724B7CD